MTPHNIRRRLYGISAAFIRADQNLKQAVADQFVQWNVTTTRGVTVSGLLVEEKPDHLLIRDANGKDFRIERKDVSEKEKNPKSLMPEDIAKTLTEEELVDLVEYLVTLQSRPVK